jgi:DNA-binding transcriptional MerR regulator
MSALLTIGEFSQLTHLSVKALRHYDDVGLLPPAEVDASTGYRRYATAQVPGAHVIRRLRDLGMPLDEIERVLRAPDMITRDRAIAGHLERMEQMLERTKATVASLRTLLDGAVPMLPIEFRSVPVTPAIAIRDHCDWDEVEGWLAVALHELQSALAINGGARIGPDGALYGHEFFERHTGEVVGFVPVAGDAAVTGRVELIDIPAAHLAVAVHQGPFSDLDRTYGALGSFVAERMLAGDGPIREHYLPTSDPDAPRTEVCWPIRRLPGKDPR